MSRKYSRLGRCLPYQYCNRYDSYVSDMLQNIDPNLQTIRISSRCCSKDFCNIESGVIEYYVDVRSQFASISTDLTELPSFEKENEYVILHNGTVKKTPMSIKEYMEHASNSSKTVEENEKKDTYKELINMRNPIVIANEANFIFSEIEEIFKKHEKKSHSPSKAEYYKRRRRRIRRYILEHFQT